MKVLETRVFQSGRSRRDAVGLALFGVGLGLHETLAVPPI
jgi:hypothetical protein